MIMNRMSFFFFLHFFLCHRARLVPFFPTPVSTKQLTKKTY